MANFAIIEKQTNEVMQVIVVADENCYDYEKKIESEELGKVFVEKLLGGILSTEFYVVQTSYNKTFRKNYAGVGYTYHKELDAFIPPKPENHSKEFVEISGIYVLNEKTGLWEFTGKLKRI